MPSAYSTTTPVGTIQSYAGTTAPPGWLMCNTSTAISRTTYAALFQVIGITFGSGNGTTTFNIPDLRGRFLRGTDNMGGIGAAGTDPDAGSRSALNAGGNAGNNVGSLQGDQFASHTHPVAAEPNSATTNGSKTYANPAGPGSMTSGSAGGSETRPKNVYTNYIIKY